MTDLRGIPNTFDPNDLGSGCINGGEPQTVMLSGREYERYLDGALNDQPSQDPDVAAERAVEDLLRAFDIDEGDHTANTPRRVVEGMREMLSGYNEDPSEHLTVTFSAPKDPGLVVVEGIVVHSTCAHHLLPFSGHATVAYRPNGGQPIVGLSKLARVVQGYARRLQVQERIGAQVVDALVDRLNPSGCMCVITARHDCMRLRGACEPFAATTTEARAGLVLDHEIALVHQRHQGAFR